MRAAVLYLVSLERRGSAYIAEGLRLETATGMNQTLLFQLESGQASHCEPGATQRWRTTTEASAVDRSVSHGIVAHKGMIAPRRGKSVGS